MAPEAGPGWGGPGRSPQVSRDQGEIFGRPGAAEQTSFYAQLYLGLYHEARGDATQARDYMIRVLPPPLTPPQPSPRTPTPQTSQATAVFAIPARAVHLGVSLFLAVGWKGRVRQMAGPRKSSKG